MEPLTASDLVALLRTGMADGSVPPEGDVVTMDDAMVLLAEGLGPLVAPDMVCVMVGAPSFSTTYEGLEGMREGWRDWADTFGELSVRIEDVREVPAGALLLVRQFGTTQHEAVPIEHPSAMLLRIKDDRIAAIEFHLDRALAERHGAQAD